MEITPCIKWTVDGGGNRPYVEELKNIKTISISIHLNGSNCNFHIFFPISQSPGQDSFKNKSRDSLSSGIHLTIASNDTMSMSPETETAAPTGLSLPYEPYLQPVGQLGRSLRFPSLPENLESPNMQEGSAEISRHVSDPVLPAS